MEHLFLWERKNKQSMCRRGSILANIAKTPVVILTWKIKKIKKINIENTRASYMQNKNQVNLYNVHVKFLSMIISETLITCQLKHMENKRKKLT